MHHRLLTLSSCVIILAACTPAPSTNDIEDEAQTSSSASEQTEEVRAYYSEQECEEATGKECAFGMCDYVPEGMTFEEVCGKNPAKGWRPTEQ